MKLYLEIDISPYLCMWKSKDNGTSNKKVMKKFYELFAQPSYVCMSNWGFNWNTLRMLLNMSDYIGIGILEVCECRESVADWSKVFGWVLEGKNRA